MFVLSRTAVAQSSSLNLEVKPYNTRSIFVALVDHDGRHGAADVSQKKHQLLSHVKGTFKLSVATVNVAILPEKVVGVIVRVPALLANCLPSSPSLVRKRSIFLKRPSSPTFALFVFATSLMLPTI